jgi:hypothetical protein
MLRNMTLEQKRDVFWCMKMMLWLIDIRKNGETAIPWDVRANTAYEPVRGGGSSQR